MADFSKHIEPLVQKEGGYVDHNVPGDRGGRTYAGIASASNPDWEGWAYLNRGEKPPKEIVHELYKRRYWDPMLLDRVKSELVAACLFSSCVLSGPRTAVRLAQAVVETTVDGKMGPNTLKFINSADAEKFAMAFALARIARFSRIVQKNKSQGKFFRGWCNRVLRELSEAEEFG